MNKATIGKFLLTAAIALALPAAASAATVRHSPVSIGKQDLTWRFANQQRRITEGMQAGKLTSREYARDEANLRSAELLRQADLRADSYGKLSRSQRAQLEHRLNGNSGRIYETKHNRADGPGTSSW